MTASITIGIATWPMELISKPEEMVSFVHRALYAVGVTHPAVSFTELDKNAPLHLHAQKMASRRRHHFYPYFTDSFYKNI